MCIAIPMKIIENLPDSKAVAEANGNRIIVDTRLLGETDADEFVLVHAGCAIGRVDKDSAADILTLMEEVSGYEQNSTEPPI